MAGAGRTQDATDPGRGVGPDAVVQGVRAPAGPAARCPGGAGAGVAISAADGSADRDPACAGGEDAEMLRAWFQIYTGMQRITGDLLEDVERRGGLTAPEFQVLWHLSAAPERQAPMNEISRLLGFSTAGTTKLVDRLGADGLIERRTSASDRRVILAALTDEGAGSALRAAEILAAGLRERFVGPLGEERVGALVDAFRLLAGEAGSAESASC